MGNLNDNTGGTPGLGKTTTAPTEVADIAAESLEEIIDDFARDAIKGAELGALEVVNRLLEGLNTKGVALLIGKMDTTEALNFGRVLSSDWTANNQVNALAISGQRETLAKILAMLINMGAVTLMGQVD